MHSKGVESAICLFVDLRRIVNISPLGSVCGGDKVNILKDRCSSELYSDYVFGCITANIFVIQSSLVVRGLMRSCCRKLRLSQNKSLTTF